MVQGKNDLLVVCLENHTKKHQKEYRQFLSEKGPEFFMRPLLTHRSGIITGWKRHGKVSRDNMKAMEMKGVWSRIRFISWFRATFTSWLYVFQKSQEEAPKGV